MSVVGVRVIGSGCFSWKSFIAGVGGPRSHKDEGLVAQTPVTALSLCMHT